MLGPVLVHFEGFPSRADVQAVGTGEANTGHVLDVRERKKKKIANSTTTGTGTVPDIIFGCQEELRRHKTDILSKKLIFVLSDQF